MRSWSFAVGLGVALLLGCGDDGPAQRPAGVSTGEIGNEPVGQSAECVDGAIEPCNEMLGEHAGIISCYEGTRTCSGGRFGACGDGQTFELDAAEVDGLYASPGLRPLAFSAPSNCLNNPCNSYCREFNEVPAAGIAPDVDNSAPPLSTWAAGDLASYPPDIVVLANREPCQTGADCQFNTACVDPSLGSCSHSVCADGDALVPGCSRCADVVCALDDDCCGTQLECAHDPCEVGSGQPLDPTCDTCVEAVCLAYPDCCNITWNAACVAHVATECAPLGQTCGCPDRAVESGGTCYVPSDRPRDWGLARDACGNYGSGWNLLEVTEAAENDRAVELIASNGLVGSWLGGIEIGVDTWSWASVGDVFFVSDATGGSLQNGYTYENWADGEPELGVIGRGIAMGGSGEWRDEQLNVELDYLCEGPPNQLGPKQATRQWDSGCTDLAETACGVECSDQVPLGLGACTARIATNLDEDCAGFDVAVGAPCEDAGVTRVPVCNHGQLEAPAGLRLIHLPVDQLGRAVLDLSDAVDCALTEAIPPGRCVNVDGCPGLDKGRALLVNPQDGTENTGECLLNDNWAIYEAVSCGSPICEAGVHDGILVSNDCNIPIQNPLGIDTSLAEVTLESIIDVPHCNPGEVLWGNSCYYFERVPELWDTARDRCRDRGMELVALNSPAENDWVRSQTDPGLDLQIGFTDRDTEGDHEWSNETCRKYTNWDSTTSQPDNVPPGSEQCTRMTKESGARWEDKACPDGQHPYVCEGPVIDAQGGCGSGQLLGPDGACYAYDPTPVSWAQAEAACLDLGLGWNMVHIDSTNVNEFVTSLADCNSIWLANPPGLLANFETPTVVVPGVHTPYIDEIGTWQNGVDPTPRATLCRGPASVQVSNPLDAVADAASCSDDSEYYFSGASFAPENVTLCPDTCARVRSERGSRIEVEIPCLPPPPPALETVVPGLYYEADCVGGGVIWDFLYYDAVTPADSRIEFEMRTAPSVALLQAGGVLFQPIAVAQAVPVDTQRCEIDPPNCPIDLFTLLGSPANTQQVLELSVRLVPGSSGEGPLLRDWRVRYSCLPSQ